MLTEQNLRPVSELAEGEYVAVYGRDGHAVALGRTYSQGDGCLYVGQRAVFDRTGDLHDTEGFTFEHRDTPPEWEVSERC
jgi:hypothetical protein